MRRRIITALTLLVLSGCGGSEPPKTAEQIKAEQEQQAQYAKQEAEREAAEKAAEEESKKAEEAAKKAEAAEQLKKETESREKNGIFMEGKRMKLPEEAIMGVSLDDFKAVQKAFEVKDEYGLAELLTQGKCGTIKKGTNVLILERKYEFGSDVYYKVRLLDGELEGGSGWMNAGGLSKR